MSSGYQYGLDFCNYFNIIIFTVKYIILIIVYYYLNRSAVDISLFIS